MIKSIFAVDHWGGMGLNGSLPWHHKEDLAYFKEQTQGHIVVMGRRTWDDPKMPKPLPDRLTYVATTRPLIGYNNVKTFKGNIVENIKKIALDNPKKIIWIVGGPGILAETRDLVDEMYITHFKGQYHTDTRIDLRKYLSLTRAYSAMPSLDKKCNWTVYRNIDIFRSVR